MENLIEINNVVKKFGKKIVLNDINLDITKGSIHGLVGRNGCGKSMLLKCISGLVPVSKGMILYKGKVIGKDIEIPEHLGALIENPGFLASSDALNNLKFLAALDGKYDINYLKEIICKVGLNPENKLKVGKYSMGMKQRLGIAQAIMNDPELLLLDEPMNGLDNHGVDEIRMLLKEINNDGTTIIIASHVKEDIDILCDTVTYLDQGRIIGVKD